MNLPHQPKTRTRPAAHVEDRLRARIGAGEWPAGAMLPSRRALAAEFGVALTTLERAVASLLADGTLRADDRRGTFVAGPRAGAPDPPSPQPPSVPNLGIIDTASEDVHIRDTDVYGWAGTITASLERTFAGGGGAPRYFDRFTGASAPVPFREAVAGLVAEGTDAIAVIGINDPPPVVEEVIAALENETRPTVYISWEDVPSPTPHVFYDNQMAGLQAAQHLLRAGYGALAFYGDMDLRWAQQRLVGAQAALRHAGLSLERLRLFSGPARERVEGVWNARPWHDYVQTEAARRRALDAVLEQRDMGRPLGIIAVNDSEALHLWCHAEERGLRLGRDFGVLGFDDRPESRLAGLTSLRPPLEALGEQAARLLLRALQGDRSAVQVRLRSHLIPRASTRLAHI